MDLCIFHRLFSFVVLMLWEEAECSMLNFLLTQPMPQLELDPDVGTVHPLVTANIKDFKHCSPGNTESCGSGQFCDLHYGVCLRLKKEGEACRTDLHCSHGLDCLFGTCHPHLNRGKDGARCERDEDCMPGHCCARKHGQKVCKKKISLGHRCYVPSGGMDYSLNELCPCVDGLVCKFRGKHRKKDDLSWRHWSTFDHFRCSPI
ncbi:unnamed protein product [Darwinula stevensoni]|uniref:Dickkopf N-terminal cysteine-rich domain-containing protein n=1 Tax=Darwinula stevensoni TaxID=69355 RepID=A0A7R8XFT7_9CRUS|nr:unnamed protein product [Darwinula stevensoni]CAG0891873.1 unnamed protein product [Darwinula stevensoni]